MSNLELIVNAVICAFIVGVIVGGVAVYVMTVPYAARRAAADRQRLIRTQMQAYKRHAGTPYIREARPW